MYTCIFILHIGRRNIAWVSSWRAKVDWVEARAHDCSARPASQWIFANTWIFRNALLIYMWSSHTQSNVAQNDDNAKACWCSFFSFVDYRVKMDRSSISLGGGFPTCLKFRRTQRSPGGGSSRAARSGSALRLQPALMQNTSASTAILDRVTPRLFENR